MLTPPQLTAISQYLKKCGILYEEVYNELVDHFANAIEDEIANGLSFDEALINVGRQFGCRRGLAHIQAKLTKAANQRYNRSLRHYFSICTGWPNLPLTLAGIWLLYTLVGLAPDMMTVAYVIMVISAIPFLAISLLTGKHLWQYKQQKRVVAWSMEGATLLSRSLGTLLISVYPNLLVYFGLIVPKSMPMNSTDHGIFFVITCVVLFLCFVQMSLVADYSKSIDTTLTYPSR